MAGEAIKFSEKKQNKGYYAIQGHSRSARSVPIERRMRLTTSVQILDILRF